MSERVEYGIWIGGFARAIAGEAEAWRGEAPAGVDGDAASAFYLRSARGRRLGFAKLVYKSVLSALTAAERQALLDAWCRSQAGPEPDWLRRASGLVEHVERAVQAGEAPAWWLDLARHDAALAAVDWSENLPVPVEELEQAVLNPSLVVIEHAHALPALLHPERIAHPAQEPTLVAYFLAQVSLAPSWAPLDAAALAALRIVAEAIPHPVAAAEAGVSVPALRAVLQTAADAGLLSGASV